MITWLLSIICSSVFTFRPSPLIVSMQFVMLLLSLWSARSTDDRGRLKHFVFQFAYFGPKRHNVLVRAAFPDHCPISSIFLNSRMRRVKSANYCVPTSQTLPYVCQQFAQLCCPYATVLALVSFFFFTLCTRLTCRAPRDTCLCRFVT